jgi:hypothetical protein
MYDLLPELPREMYDLRERYDLPPEVPRALRDLPRARS